jgi:hypothetical protein
MNLRKIAGITMISSVLGTGLAVVPATAATAAPKMVAHYGVTSHEDGSGRITRTVLVNGKSIGQQVYRLSEGMIPWDCRTMGNRICGPNAAANGVAQSSATTIVLAGRPGFRQHVALDLRTPALCEGSKILVGKPRTATDEDAEGEVIR